MTMDIISKEDAHAKGLKRFFLGEPCRNGHVSERGVSHGKCIRCITERSKKWGEMNPERRKEQVKRAQLKHKPKFEIYRKKWLQENKEWLRERDRQYRLEKPEISRRKALTWRNKNLESARAAANKWYADNPDKATILKNKRRARKVASGGTYTAEDASAILSAQSHKCAYCRTDLRTAKRHLDHIMPLALGGSNDRTNLQYLCAPCNLSKGARDPIEFAQQMGRLL